MLWVVLVALSTIVVCVLLGRYDRSAVAREWDMMLGGRASEHLRTLERTCQLDHMMAEDSWQAASQAMKDDDRPEVVRLLDLSYQVLEAATVNRRARLRGVRVCARMAAAMAPAPSLLPEHFETAELRSLAGLATLLQHILVSAHERFVVQAHVIAFGFVLALRSMRRARGVADLATALLRFDIAKMDWRSLDEAHVEMVRILLLSAAASRRDVPAVARF
jgi:hypothetical protein